MFARFAAANLNPQGKGSEFAKVVKALEQDDKLRADFFKACLTKLGLQVNQTEQSVPSLSRLHLSSISAPETAELVASLEEIITKSADGEEFIKAENDVFHLEKPSKWSMGSLSKAISSTVSGSTDGTADEGGVDDSILDYDKVIKRIVAHEEELPSSKETPYFNHQAFYANLSHYIQKTNGTEGWFGKHLLYGEVVTSTSTMLEKYIRRYFCFDLMADLVAEIPVFSSTFQAASLQPQQLKLLAVGEGQMSGSLLLDLSCSVQSFGTPWY
jgi:biotin--protein ligase